MRALRRNFSFNRGGESSLDKGITALCGECGGHILLSSDEKKKRPKLAGGKENG
jgi:hypothetical protein